MEDEKWEKCGDLSNTTDCNYKVVPREELHIYEKYENAVHCMIYAPWNQKVFGKFETKHAIMMHMRFDGSLGFPGGIVDEGESVVQALNRELKEEVHMDTLKRFVKEDDHIISHFNSKRKMILHFYALEVTLDEFTVIEKSAQQAEEFGIEVLGNIRVPLYILDNGVGGFPTFLTNSFAGNAREQLLYTLKHLELVTPKHIAIAETCIKRKEFVLQTQRACAQTQKD